ncbi:hypothetical protein Tco_0554666 [Tanacetum coccineum]
MSNLKKCLADANLHVPLDETKIDKTLRFVEELVEIMDRKVRSLKRSKISLVKVRWNSKRGPDFMLGNLGSCIERQDCNLLACTVFGISSVVDLDRMSTHTQCVIGSERSLYRHHCVVMISILVTPRVFALAGCDNNNGIHVDPSKIEAVKN